MKTNKIKVFDEATRRGYEFGGVEFGAGLEINNPEKRMPRTENVFGEASSMKPNRPLVSQEMYKTKKLRNELLL